MVKSVIYNIYGVVQGVGFRPFVHRIAVANRIVGKVINRGSFVEVVAQGTDNDLASFRNALQFEAPERANIVKIEDRIAEFEAFEQFSIEESKSDKGAIFIPPDIATCKQCRKELFDKHDRRYLHSFINCTACGPRLTILEALPYDRERTSMKAFDMCKECSSEYCSITSRRYDAQPVCCNDCGPEVYILNSDLRGNSAITETRRRIMQGAIAAIKGIGGFHLACDGRNIEAVERLRQLKHRPRKPFAVMMRDLETVRNECVLSDKEVAWLDGCEKPILLLDKKPDCSLPDILAPGNPTLGVMLPYAPLQMLLFALKGKRAILHSLRLFRMTLVCCAKKQNTVILSKAKYRIRTIQENLYLTFKGLQWQNIFHFTPVLLATVLLWKKTASLFL